MITLYTWGTPNGYKISIMLEETKLNYETVAINILEGEQFQPDFLRIAPNNRIPAIVDKETNISLMESGAILMYLARKTGQFLAKEGTENYWQTMQWLMWQMGGFGPMLGQAHHFMHYNPDVSDYANKRYGDEAKRLYKVLDGALAKTPYVAGDYSIADMAIWPWAARFELQGIKMNEYPNVLRWYKEIAKRQAVIKGYNIPNPREIPMPE